MTVDLSDCDPPLQTDGADEKFIAVSHARGLLRRPDRG
jgi:hypothetical protein